MALVNIILVEARFSASTVISISLINIAFFRPNPECGRFVVGEVKCRDRHLARFIVTSMDQLEGFLKQNTWIAVREKNLFARYLRLCEHIHQPTTYRPICTARD